MTIKTLIKTYTGTRAELAEKSRLSEACLSRLASGKRKGSAWAASKLAQATGKSLGVNRDGTFSFSDK